MRHPFDGIIHLDGMEPSGPGTAAPAGDAERPSTRRSFLGALTAIVGGAAGLLAASEASAQRGFVTTQALGEEGGRGRPYPPGLGGYPPPGHGGIPPGHRRRVTTQALGEEGGRRFRRGYPY